MTGNGIIVRRALPADLDSLISLLEVLFSIEEDFTFDEPRQRRGLAMMLKNPRGCILVAEADDKVVGMCSGQLIVSTAEGGPALLIEDVIVREEFREKGIGRALMKEIAAWAHTRGATRLQLLADRNNHPALSFYEKLGWQTTQLICLRKREA
jgi:ribosomal protein S18 acetylase RimI-like enzyme